MTKQNPPVDRLKVRVTKTIEFFDTDAIRIEDLDINVPAESGDPAVDIPRKVEQIAEILGVSEAVAQKILLTHGGI